MEVRDAAASVFGTALPRAEQYAELLATRGVQWGVVGPREVERVWERHVLNSVAVARAVLQGASVVDVGSGAGLPGIPLALVRPDVRVVLLEPLLRRVSFLEGVVAELDLGDRVEVVRGRAMPAGVRDELAHRATYDVVTCRAVAPLPRLVEWCAPLVLPGGRLVAMKGSSAADEVADAAAELRAHRLRARVQAVAAYEGAEPTWLVVCSKSAGDGRPRDGGARRPSGR